MTEEFKLWHYRAKPIYVVDGDTIDVDIDLGFGMTKRERVRLAGIDAPEVRGEEREEGLLTKSFVENLLSEIKASGGSIFLKTEKERGKYGRYIAYVYVDVPYVVNMLDHEFTGWFEIGEALVKAGLAEAAEY